MAWLRSLRCFWFTGLLTAWSSGCSSGEGASGQSGGEAGVGASQSSAGSGVVAGSSPSSGGAASNGGSSASAGAGGVSAQAGSGSAQAGNGTATGGSANSGPPTCRSKGDGKSTITLINHCTGTLSFRGTDIEGGELSSGEHACRDVGDATTELPAIRYWGFIGEDPGGEKHTLAELTLNTEFNDFDWYNISHVDAHNLPMRVEAVEMPDCRVLTCAESLLEQCPAEGRLEDSSGSLISCFSPDRDDPNSTVAQYFEASCDDAYSWSGDDSESVAACAGEDYDVIFCP